MFAVCVYNGCAVMKVGHVRSVTCGQGRVEAKRYWWCLLLCQLTPEQLSNTCHTVTPTYTRHVDGQEADHG